MVAFLPQNEVRDVSVALKVITQEWLRNRYFGLDRSDYPTGLTEEDFQYTWEYFK